MLTPPQSQSPAEPSNDEARGERSIRDNSPPNVQSQSEETPIDGSEHTRVMARDSPAVPPQMDDINAIDREMAGVSDQSTPAKSQSPDSQHDKSATMTSQPPSGRKRGSVHDDSKTEPKTENDSTKNSPQGSSTSLKSTTSKKMSAESSPSIRSAALRPSVPAATSRTPSLRSLDSVRSVNQAQSPGIKSRAENGNGSSSGSLKANKGKKTPSQTSLGSKTPSASSLKSLPRYETPKSVASEWFENSGREANMLHTGGETATAKNPQEVEDVGTSKDPDVVSPIQSDTLSESKSLCLDVTETALQQQNSEKEQSPTMSKNIGSRKSTPISGSKTSLLSQIVDTAPEGWQCMAYMSLRFLHAAPPYAVSF